jgi:3-hydroxyacyl-CoA dehydrogenase/enoyl-CoA hydratase/3-hydroxybutyryl-CoA epimerase
MPESAVYVVEKMAHGFRRPGRLGGAGFYDYHDDGHTELWAGLSVFARGRHASLDDESIAQRLMLCQSIAALRQVATTGFDPTRIDREAVEGWQYPAALGGPIARIKSEGLAQFRATCERLAERFGERFQPPATLDA